MHFSSRMSLFLICSFSVIGILSCEHKQSGPVPAKAGPKLLVAEGYIVKAQPFQNEYTASGSLLPNEEIQILPEVSGRVTDITFNEGKHVEKGQVLVRIYNDDIKAQIRKLQAQRELQVKIKNRQAELLHIGGISQQDYETTTTQIQSIDADIAYSEAQLRKTTIYAPFAGRIGIRNISRGAVITPSTVIATLQQTRILKMDFTVPDQYKSDMNNGKNVYFTVNGSLDTFQGTISALEPTADPVTRTIKVRALVHNDNHKLTAGSFTHVTVPLQNTRNSILIPSQAIIPTDRDKEVAVVRAGKAKLITVRTGTRTNDQVEILQGLQAGDTIITTGIMQVKSGMSVRVKFSKG